MKGSRRSFLAAAAAAPLLAKSGALLAAGGNDGSTQLSKMKKMTNKDFYKADGSFDADAAKKAYYALME